MQLQLWLHFSSSNIKLLSIKICCTSIKSFRENVAKLFNCVGCACEFMLSPPSSQKHLVIKHCCRTFPCCHDINFCFVLKNILDTVSVHECLMMADAGRFPFKVLFALCSRFYSLSSKDTRYCSKHFQLEYFLRPYRAPHLCSVKFTVACSTTKNAT